MSTSNQNPHWYKPFIKTPTDEEVYDRTVQLFDQDCSISHDAAVKAQLIAEGATESQANASITQFHLAFDDHCRPIIPG